MTMRIDSRDSDILKPPELDELGQIVMANDPGIEDAEIDRQVEAYPIVVTARDDEDAPPEGFLFASLERIGGTPCILWGLGSVKPNRPGKRALASMAEELLRRAAITFPDEDVLVGGRFSQPSGYGLLDGLEGRVPRPDHKPTGEERAWGRRLARRFGCGERYDDHRFHVTAEGREPVADVTPINGKTPKIARGLFDSVDRDAGEALVAFGWAFAEDLAARLEG